LLRRLRALGPDIVIGASDIPHVALGAWAAKRLGVPCAIDLYDNFEGFGQARIPGMVQALRRAVRSAALVTATSEPLRELVVDTYHAKGGVIAMPSTVDKAIFRPLDRLACRRALGLPEDARLLGTAGGLARDKGVGVLYDAWQRIAREKPDAHLVLAGPADPDLPPPTHERVHYLGMLPHARTAELFGALDVGVIYLRDTPFGRYCFPQKAYEMFACKLPVVAAAIGVMPQLLSSEPACLYPADDADALAQAVLAQFVHPTPVDLTIRDWTQLVGDLEPRLRKLMRPQKI
jgi:glycosyltransferase involved in cell wall biosynthesis